MKAYWLLCSGKKPEKQTSLTRKPHYQPVCQHGESKTENKRLQWFVSSVLRPSTRLAEHFAAQYINYMNIACDKCWLLQDKHSKAFHIVISHNIKDLICKAHYLAGKTPTLHAHRMYAHILCCFCPTTSLSCHHYLTLSNDHLVKIWQ